MHALGARQWLGSLRGWQSQAGAEVGDRGDVVPPWGPAYPGAGSDDQDIQHRKGTRSSGRKSLCNSTSRITAKPPICDGGQVMGFIVRDVPVG